MRKPILSFAGKFDRAKVQRYVERSRREHHFGHPEPVEDGQLFRVSFEKGAKAPFQVYSHLSHDRYVLRRTRLDARLTPADDVALSLVESGSMLVKQAGVSMRAQAGQMTLLSMRLPYVVEHFPSEQEPFKVIFTHIPGHALDPQQRIRRGPMLIRSSEYETIRRILLLLLECGDELDIKASNALFSLLARKVRISLNIEETPKHTHATAEDRFEAVLQHINHNFSNSLLDLRSVADAIGVAPRTINYILTRNGTRFSDLLWNTRVGAVRSWLLDPDMAHVPLQQIALAAGFKSPSHMTNKFRSIMNITPRAFRSSALKKR